MTRIVIIGAGIVGCSLADELALRGATDVTVVDQGPLFATGGSTSHAPGLVFQTNPSRSMAQLATYTVEKLTGLALDGAPVFDQRGGLEVALTPERLADLHRRAGWATSWGVPATVVGPDETARLHPLLDRAALLGGLHTPTDGLAHAVPAAEAQARRAMAAGVRFLPHHGVEEVLTDGTGAVRGVRTTQGELAAEVVVCCAGFWGPRVAALVGLELPLVPFAHQYATTTPLPALAALGPGRRPIVRHQGEDLYYREHGDALGIGSYGHRPMPVAQDEIRADGDRMPSQHPFTPEDFAPAWDASVRLLPGLRDATVADGMNGIFSFTPDGGPLVGEHRDVPGFWVAEAVWVTHSAGVGRAVAELLTSGTSTVALHEADLHRFAPVQVAPDAVRARATRAFVEVYDVLHPLDPSEVARDLRRSPFHPRQVEHGAVFLEAHGWERPQWYAGNAALADGLEVPGRDDWSARHWSPIAAAEARRTREAVAMYDMSPLMRIEVRGPGAASFLQRMTSNDVDRPVGTVTYTLLLDADGGVRSDLTVARLGPGHFQVGANGPLDLDRLTAQAPADVVVVDATPGGACLGVWGPRARDVVQPLTPADLSHEGLGYFMARRTTVAGVPVTVLRVSYVGDLGWELHTTADVALRLWDAVAEAGAPFGIVPAGRAALDALRIEKGYRAWGKDVTAEHDPHEAGLGWAVKPGKGDFVGRDALAAKGEPQRRLVPLVLDGDDAVPLGGEPVAPGPGYVTSGAWSPTLGRTIAYAWLPADQAAAGQRVQVGWFDRALPATVATEPLVDPAMELIRR